MNTKLKNTIQYSLSLLLGIVFFYFLYRNVDMNKMLDELSGADYRLVLLSMALGCLSHWSRGVRWVIALRPLGYQPQKRKAFVSVMVGYVMNMILPRAGEFARCVFLRRVASVPIEVSFGAVIGERAFDFVILLSITALTFFVEWNIIKGFLNEYADFGVYERMFYDNIWILWIAIMLFVTVIGIIYWKRRQLAQYSFINKLQGFLRGIWKGMSSVKLLTKKEQVFYLAHTLIIWICYYMMMYVLFFAIDPTSHLPIMAGFTVLVMGGIGMVIPVQGGIGSFHLFVQLSVMAYGVAAETAKYFAFFAHTTQTLMVVIVGAASAAMGLLLWGRKKN